VVLVKPTADALRSTSTGSVAGSAPTDGDVGAGSGSAVDAGGFSGGPATFDLPALPAPTAGASRDRGSGGPTAGTVELVAPAAARRSLTGDGSRSPVPLIFFGLAIAAVAFWCVAGRGSEELALDAGDNR
jgi:hypothetical protein